MNEPILNAVEPATDDIPPLVEDVVYPVTAPDNRTKPCMARLMQLRQTYHIRDCPAQVKEEPMLREHRASRFLKTDRRAFVDELDVGEEWVRMPHGSLERCSLIILDNVKPRWQVNPTDFEKEETEAKVLHISFWSGSHAPTEKCWSDHPICTGANLLVLPGFSQDFLPQDLSGIWLRCALGKAKVVVTVIPE